MRSSLDCVPCFIRQALDASRAVSGDPALHERTVREIAAWIADADLDLTPPSFGQHIHRRLREVAASADPFKDAKDRQNSMALQMLPGLRTLVEGSAHPLSTAVRLAIAGNAIDMGVTTEVTGSDLRHAMDQALEQPLCGDPDGFYRAVEAAGSILYLADNAGEIAFDRLLIEQLDPGRVTVAVRGAPVLNDATLFDAHAVRLDEVVEVVDNGSDAPGTILPDCSEEFRRRFADAELIISKGQGNFESLNEEAGNIFFLFKVKCEVIAQRVGMPVGAHVLTRSQGREGIDKNKGGA
ncbi:MAG: DUF89 family protein [Thermoleophilia bacterium]|nr:DUF89 family protein [Thermoleophilia bacterium]